MDTTNNNADEVARQALADALKNQESLTKIKSIVAPNPKIVALQDDCNEWNALHLACGCEFDTPLASSEIVRFLVDACPKALDGVGSYSQTPLYAACYSGNRVSLEVVQILVEKALEGDPEVLCKTNKNDEGYWETPLGMALRSSGVRQPDPAIVKYLARRCPEAIGIPDCEGKTPLHHAMTQDTKTIELLLNLSTPEALRIVGHNGETALHVASRYVNDLEVLKAIIHQWPCACLHLNIDNESPYDVAAKITYRDNKQIVDFLRESMTQAALAVVGSTHGEMEPVRAMIQGPHLPELIKDPKFRDLLSGIKRMNDAGRDYITDDPGNVIKGLEVLGAASDNIECLRLHLKECQWLKNGNNNLIGDPRSEGTRLDEPAKHKQQAKNKEMVEIFGKLPTRPKPGPPRKVRKVLYGYSATATYLGKEECGGWGWGAAARKFTIYRFHLDSVTIVERASKKDLKFCTPSEDGGNKGFEPHQLGEFLKVADSLAEGDKTMLKWNHEMVTRIWNGRSGTGPDHPVIGLQKI